MEINEKNKEVKFNFELNGYATIEVDAYINDLLKEIAQLKAKISILKEESENQRALFQNDLSNLENKIIEMELKNNGK